MHSGLYCCTENAQEHAPSLHHTPTEVAWPHGIAVASMRATQGQPAIPTDGTIEGWTRGVQDHVAGGGTIRAASSHARVGRLAAGPSRAHRTRCRRTSRLLPRSCRCRHACNALSSPSLMATPGPPPCTPRRMARCSTCCTRRAAPAPPSSRAPASVLSLGEV